MPLLGAEEATPRQVVDQALNDAGAIPLQAQALIELTWPADGPGNPEVAAIARGRLIEYGDYALRPLWEALFHVRPEHHADLTATLIDARRKERSGSPRDFLPALEEIIWYGSIEARRLAIAEISLFVFPPAILSTIDAIHEDPELALHGIRALGRMRNERGRFFLGRALNHAAPRYKVAAASALLRLPDTGMRVLQNAIRSETREVREAALGALLPYVGPDDLTALYEYLDSHATTDDPQLLEAIRVRAQEVEILLEEHQFSEAASGESEEADPE